MGRVFPAEMVTMKYSYYLEPTMLELLKSLVFAVVMVPVVMAVILGLIGVLTGTEYLICKQVIRDHDEFAGRRGCRINAQPAAEGGFTVWFTLPAR